MSPLRLIEVLLIQQETWRPEDGRPSPARMQGQVLIEPMTVTATSTSGVDHARVPGNPQTLGGESI